MKLLMTTDCVGGVWTFALELARGLARHGVETVLATQGAPLSREARAEASAIPRLELRESTFKLEWMESPWEDVERARRWLLEIEREVRPDLVHLNEFSHGALPWRAPALVVGHSCVTSWWVAVHGEEPPAGWARYRQEVQRGLRAAAAVTAPSRAMLAALERHYGPFAQARVIANGRDASRFAPAHKEPFVFAAGRLWDEAKNVAALRRIAPRLSWPLVLAGEGAVPSESTDRVRLLGRIPAEAVAAWMSRAAIYALPALYEPFGLSVLEAALSGCAPVIGDLPSLREVWDGAAIFVPPRDDTALAEGLERLSRDETARSALAARARQRALALTPEATALGYLALYRRLVRPGVATAEEASCAS